jgi:hypothetical protein
MNIERRKFLATSTGTAATMLAGCTGVLSDPAMITVEQVDHTSVTQYQKAFDVAVRVENTGDETGTDTVTLSFAGDLINSEEVTLEGGATQDLSFTIPANRVKGGTHPLSVATDEDSYSTQMRVTDPVPASLLIDTVDVPRTTAHDEPVQVTVTVRNNGDLTAEQTIAVETGTDTIASEAVTVAGQEQTDVSFTVPADEFFSGEYTLTITTDDDERTATFNVENPNPYDKQTLTVGLEQRTPARHDIQEVVTDALTYWENNAEQYAGYPINYEYRANASDPDVEIVVVEQILNCGDHTGEEVAGCAPLVRRSAPEPATIRIVDGYRKEWMTTTLKHEIGHTLGLDHQAEPLHIMSNEIEDRIPNYEERREVIDLYVSSFDPYREGGDNWQNALAAWSNRNPETTESRAREASNKFLEAQRAIDSARDIAENLNEDTAYNLLNESYKKTRAMRYAADAAIAMAQEAQKTYGDPEPHREESNEYIDEANEYSFQETSRITRAFGFPARE